MRISVQIHSWVNITTLFSFSLLSFLLCTSVAATSRGSPEPASGSKHDEKTKLYLPRLETPLAAEIRLSDSSYVPVDGRPVIDGQPIKLLSFYSHQNSIYMIKTTNALDEMKTLIVSGLTEENSPWLTEGKWKLAVAPKGTSSAISLEPPAEIRILWKNIFVVQDTTPVTQERPKINLPVVTVPAVPVTVPAVPVTVKHPLETGVRLSEVIASTTIIPSGTTYISYYHSIRKYLKFEKGFITTWPVGDEDRKKKMITATTLNMADNEQVLGGRWKLDKPGSTGPDMLRIYTKGNELELYVQSLTIQRNRSKGRWRSAAAVQ